MKTLKIAEEIIRELLLAGSHAGECDNLPDRTEACSLHIAASDARRAKAEAFLLLQTSDVKIGDIVQLKSGGPLMLAYSWPTSKQFDHTADELYCVWFDSLGAVHGEGFLTGMLKLASAGVQS